MTAKTPIKQIRRHCLDCCCGSYSEVEHCEIPDCALFEYRLGKRPKKSENEQIKPDERKTLEGNTLGQAKGEENEAR